MRVRDDGGRLGVGNRRLVKMGDDEGWWCR